MDQIKAGSTVVFKNMRDMVNSHHFEGRRDGLYVYRTHDGPKSDQKLLLTVSTNAKGEVIHVKYADGRSLTFTPHNCTRTVGACSYVETTGEGRTRKHNRFTEVDGDTISFSVTHAGKVTYTGTAALGAFNWPMDTTIIPFGAGDGDTIKVLRTDFK